MTTRRGKATEVKALFALAAALLPGCQPEGAGNQAVPKGPGAARAESPMYRVDARHPTIAVAVGLGASAEDRKFVIVEIRELTNPAREAVSFEVRFRPEQGPAVQLGTFSPYPADNPGRFLVATGGKVRSAGDILVSIKGADSRALRSVSAVATVGLGPG